MHPVPLAARLKRRTHREVAFAQDVLVAEAFDIFPSCVLHGGTAIWRCYGGARFSEDVDADHPAYSAEKAARLRSALAAKGFRELKFKATAATMSVKLELGGAPLSFEAALRRPPARAVVGYETIEGGRMIVATLPPESLVAEKVAAYLAGRKVRDLFDVFFLLQGAAESGDALRAVRTLEEGYRPPLDERGLKALILAGAVPTAVEMLEGIRRWARRST